MTETLNAPVPSRSTGSLTLSVGLLAVPVSVYAGTEDVSVSRTEWATDTEGNYCKVGRLPALKGEGDTYTTVLIDAEGRPDYSSIVKRIETERGLVDLTDDEVAQAMDLPGGTAQIVCFQPLAVMNTGAYVPENVMQVRPNRKADSLTIRAFALLMRAMRVEGTFALVRFCLRGTLRYGALLPTGRLYCLRFDNEIRTDLPLPDADLTDDEVMQGRMLIAALTDANVKPLVNDARERVLSYAERKAVEGGAPEPVAPDTSKAATSLMDTLKAAVTAAASGGE